MDYYHQTREAAQKVADEIETSRDDIAYCKTELEPGNGWVIVAVPKVFDITDLGDRCEVRHPDGHRLTPRPASHKKLPSLARPAKPAASLRPRVEVVEPKEPIKPAWM